MGHTGPATESLYLHYKKISEAERESSVTNQEWSHLKECIFETAQEILGQER